MTTPDRTADEAAREPLDVSGRSRQVTYSRLRLQDALAARDAALSAKG
jgi:hypothetical protein